MATGRAKESGAASRPGSSGASPEKLLEQVPPHDERAEAGVLGSMLMDTHAAAIAVEMLKVDDFYISRHRIIYAALHKLFHETKAGLDEVLLSSELEKARQLDEAGGREAIGRLIMDTPSPSNIEGYCNVVRARAVERELINAAGKILSLARAPSQADGEGLLEVAEQMVYDVADRRSNQDIFSMSELMAQALTEAEQVQVAHREGREIPCLALPTGYADLDRLLTGGMWPGELIIIAGRPSMGKTTFALNIARNLAVEAHEGTPVAVFSLEMPKEQVAKNILCALAKLQGQKMRRYDFNEEDFGILTSASAALSKAPIFIDDTSALSLSQLRARCRRLRHAEKIGLVIVDYLQLMQGTPGLKREQEVSELSRGLKALARHMKIPVIVLSQLNRSAERRENEDKRPQLADLRESGAIEQDADVVIMLYRQEYYDLEGNAKTKNTGEALVLKNRNGPVGKVQLTFLKDILRFESYVPGQDTAAGN